MPDHAVQPMKTKGGSPTMSYLVKTFNGLAAVAAVIALQTAVLPPAAYADDKDVIDYRQHIMKSMDADTAAVGQIVSGVSPVKHLAGHLESIALAASISLKSFEANVPGGKSKPEVWTKWADFSKRMKEFADNTAKLAKIATAHSKEEAVNGEVMTELTQALSCKQCHDAYRDETKK